MSSDEPSAVAVKRPMASFTWMVEASGFPEEARRGVT